MAKNGQQDVSSKLRKWLTEIIKPKSHLTYNDCVTGIRSGRIVIHRWRYKRWIVQEFQQVLNDYKNKNLTPMGLLKYQEAMYHVKTYAYITHRPLHVIRAMVEKS